MNFWLSLAMANLPAPGQASEALTGFCCEMFCHSKVPSLRRWHGGFDSGLEEETSSIDISLLGHKSPATWTG